MRDRPNLAERILGRIGFALALPTMAPVALLAGALARVQKSNRAVRTLLTPLLGLAVFLGFLVTVIVFIPYYVLLFIGSAVGVIDVRVPRRVTVGEIAVEGAVASFAVDCTLPHQDTTAAKSILTAVIGAIAGGRTVQFYRSPPQRNEVFGPFATAAADIETRVASFVDAVDYGSSADCWFVAGGMPDAADLLSMASGWDVARVQRVLDFASMSCHVETMVDQGSHNSRVVVCGRDVTAERERVAAVVNATSFS